MTLAENYPTSALDLPPYDIKNINIYNPPTKKIIQPSTNPEGDMLYFVNGTELINYLATLPIDEREINQIVNDQEAKADTEIANLIIIEINKIIRNQILMLGHNHLSNEKLFEQIAILGSAAFTKRKRSSDFDVTISISRKLNETDSKIVYKAISEKINLEFLNSLNETIKLTSSSQKQLNSLDVFIWYLSNTRYWRTYRPIYL
ncbi:MAG: hypothetical protein UT13_C0001G0329 [Candidatus Pacebacteria bacterium GW2011_GWF2_38_9]|nr:MAG: hypothetical protein US01_C0001G0337 [candidate division TM6 bacterium GW2011_GWF2_28_16]KKQ10318.1 MAG: hypothetical protein US20_C0001G0032 [Candidatus Pacebacteria bacterium GW2011_GWF1_36_5]KKQ88682.1 MAG: hypothetical protein UT13_C0001G0329 [Candidatus Pacebacteria bacterium GW2011_GWF2_38_9]HAZ73672.1 hypothetical protein [Candidatus Paceibacterota bacterium]